MLSLPPRVRHSILAAAAIVVPGLLARAATLPNRIAAIESSSRADVAHNTPGFTRVASDLGQAPAAQRMLGITLHFSRTDAQQKAITQLLQDQANPASPRYHQWLTPQQFGAQFGLSAADLAKVTSWLTAQGLTVTSAPPSNTYVVVSGTVAQVQAAFGTSIHKVSLQGVQHISNLTDPALPASLAGVVSAITGLDDLRPHPHTRIAPAKPAFTQSGTQAHFISPSDFATIYDTKPLLNSAINGTGVTIAVMGQVDIAVSDIAAFRSAASLPLNNPTVVLYGPDPGGAVDQFSTGYLQEADLDLEWAGGIAPNASIVYVNSGTNAGVFDALSYAINTPLTSAGKVAPILSISYGSCEPFSSPAVLASYNSQFEQANLQGQTIVAASGDAGAADCDFAVPAAGGLAVDFPGDTPSVTSIGGTDFSDAASPTTYWTAAGSSDVISSALSYIPEVVWNNTSVGNGPSSSGGGASAIFGKPAWQNGNGVPSDSARDVPDLSFHASEVNDPYLVCSQNSCTNGFLAANGGFLAFGGTSVGTPSFAGVLALVEQKLNATGGLGNINPVLYGLAKNGNTTALHDVISGNNDIPCASGSPNCPDGGGSIGYAATAGYDLATGLGSVDALNLANQWSTAVPSGSTTTTGTTLSAVTISTSSALCGITSASVPVTITVNSVQFDSGGNPVLNTASNSTGSVQLQVDGTAVGTPVVLSGGVATLTLNTGTLSSGSHILTASYTGDPTYEASRGTLSIDTVSATSPDFALTPCTSTVTAGSGSAASAVTLNLTSVNGFSGPVTFSVSAIAYPGLTAEYAFAASPVTVSTSAAATTTLTLSAFGPSGTVLTPASRKSPTLQSANHVVSRRHLYGTGAGTAALASVLILVLPRRRRFAGLLVAVLSIGAIGIVGCGSGAGAIPAGTVTPPTTTVVATETGSYTINVTATGTNSAGQALVHTQTLTFNVQ